MRAAAGPEALRCWPRVWYIFREWFVAASCVVSMMSLARNKMMGVRETESVQWRGYGLKSDVDSQKTRRLYIIKTNWLKLGGEGVSESYWDKKCLVSAKCVCSMVQHLFHKAEFCTRVKVKEIEPMTASICFEYLLHHLTIFYEFLTGFVVELHIGRSHKGFIFSRHIS
jgi:hypothetical protein